MTTQYERLKEVSDKDFLEELQKPVDPNMTQHEWNEVVERALRLLIKAGMTNCELNKDGMLVKK